MNRNSFYELVHSPDSFSDIQLKRLEEIVEEFSYFNPARILLLKAYQQKEHIGFNNLLSLSALHTRNRQVLFNLIKNEPVKPLAREFEQVAAVEAVLVQSVNNSEQGNAFEEIKTESSPDQLTAEQLIEKRLQEINYSRQQQEQAIAVEPEIQIEVLQPIKQLVAKKEDTETKIDGHPETESVTIQNSLSEDIGKEETIEPAPLDELQNMPESIVTEQGDEPKNHSFTEWLRIKSNTETSAFEAGVANSVKAENYVSEEIKAVPVSDLPNDRSNSRLIDKFIETEPRIEIKKQEFYSASNMARKSVAFDADLVSETLAGVYADQGLYDKAIQAYQKLALKYPDKSVFFAARIQKLDAIKNSKA